MTPARKPGQPAGAKAPTIKVPVRDLTSSGGVVFRREGGGAEKRTEIAIISVGPQRRWQLPKGLVDAGETPEVTAVREAREEAGVVTRVHAHIETIEYWYAGLERGIRVRFHKHVHFYLLEYLSGDTRDHDIEVNEARWIPIEEAFNQLTFEGERRVVERARKLLEQTGESA